MSVDTLPLLQAGDDRDLAIATASARNGFVALSVALLVVAWVRFGRTGELPSTSLASRLLGQVVFLGSLVSYDRDG